MATFKSYIAFHYKPEGSDIKNTFTHKTGEPKQRALCLHWKMHIVLAQLQQCIGSLLPYQCTKICLVTVCGLHPRCIIFQWSSLMWRWMWLIKLIEPRQSMWYEHFTRHLDRRGACFIGKRNGPSVVLKLLGRFIWSQFSVQGPHVLIFHVVSIL